MRTLSDPRRARLTPLLATFTALAAALIATAPTANAADPPLRDLAAAKGKGIGTAVTGSKLTGTYGEIAAREFNWLTPGNAMKWASVEPTRGNFDWTGADRIVDFAEAHDQDVRGHTLVRHSQNPDWLQNGTWTPARLGQLMKDHITAVSRSNASRNGGVPSGGSVSFGFNGTWSGTWSGTNPVPTVPLG